ncbi:hypothetical protein JOF53_003866 [Crossiella equi]|uniref:IPT/TIG domain-containing protein n=1 Tax=Crossiella equi TaxID=130796 RepID=A0ABS5AEI1_9PSEU|nr:hypothetical protein [Crossiella equi]MBP2474994.1 hypothetical protein [Crossiella equi]
MMRTARLAVAVLLGLFFALPGLAVAQQVPVLSADRTSGLDPSGEYLVVRGVGFAPQSTVVLNARVVTPAEDGSFAVEVHVTPATPELRVDTPGVAPLSLAFRAATSTPASTSAQPTGIPSPPSSPLAPRPGTDELVPAPRAAAPGADASPKLTVSKTSGLNPAGEKVTVSGSGYNEAKGIYVAVCVDNGPGKMPTPCLGGADMTGKNGSSAWISSNPPPYGKELAKPYGPGGTFTVELNVTAKDEYTDCAVLKCAIVSRADHTLGADRGQDFVVPVSFGTGGGTGPTTTTPGGAGNPGTENPSGGGTGGSGGTGAGAGGRTGGLANTGASVLPLLLGGFALLGGGALALFLGRRKPVRLSIVDK